MLLLLSDLEKEETETALVPAEMMEILIPKTTEDLEEGVEGGLLHDSQTVISCLLEISQIMFQNLNLETSLRVSCH